MSNIRPLSKELQQKAIEELNEDVSRIPQDIQAIKDWFKQQKYIIARTDDQSILSFLRGCKFSLERTKEKMETFYTMHTLVPEFFKNRSPFNPEIQDVLKCGLFLPLLKQKDLTAPRTIISNIGAFDSVKINKVEMFKTIMMICDILSIEDDQAVICGMHVLVSHEGMTMAHILPIPLMLKGMKYYNEALPNRFKGFHMMDMPKIFEAAFFLLKALMSPKIQNRMFVYNTSNIDDLYRRVEKEDLSKEYGGNGPSIKKLTDIWKAKVESYAEWFQDSEKYGTDEKLRPGKPKTTQEWFGVEGVDGSFRKLNVD